MQDAITAQGCLARLAELTGWSLLVALFPTALRIAKLVARFQGDSVCPAGMFDFEIPETTAIARDAILAAKRERPWRS